MDRRVVGEVRVPDRRTDLQPAAGRRFDLVEPQAIDVDQLRGRFDVQLHQVDQRRAASEESDVRALLRSLRLGGGGDRLGRILRTDEFERMHDDAPRFGPA